MPKNTHVIEDVSIKCDVNKRSFIDVLNTQNVKCKIILKHVTS